ncbi:MAG: zinc-dependent dehydrogenase [Candidatus Diapherotrites archaeon]
MRAAIYYSNSDLRLKEMPVPKAGEGELLLKVMASGICGSDVMEWYRKKKAPLVLGHEVAGEIVEAGKGVTQFKKGDRVFATHHVPCNRCFNCKTGRHTSCETLRSTNFFPGGFAEYLKIPAANLETGVLKLLSTVSFEEATFIEPLGCVVRAQRLAGMQKGYSVLVLGSGISGLLHIQLAKANGAKKVFATDINDYRLNAAKKFGAEKVWSAKEFSPEKLKEANSGKLADLVIVCAGATSAFKQAFESVERGGTILVFAPPAPDAKIEVPLNDFWCRGVNLVSSYAAVNEDLTEALSLIAEKKVNVKEMVSHRLPLAETAKGFQLTASAGESLKVIIKPQK